MNATAPDDKPSAPAAGRSYWTHGVDSFPGPVAQFRMSQLVDYDLRLTDPARTVYRFLIGWYMHTHGDALASVRHIVATLRARAPDGARHLSRSAVQRAIILLIESGWLVRTQTGNRSGASRFVPVLNVLDLATQGTLPAADLCVPEQRDIKPDSVVSRSTGTQVSHFSGTQTPDASHATGTKTPLLDPVKEPGTGNGSVSADTAAGGLGAPAPAAGFEKVWQAYGKLGNKRASRDAWAALVEPDADLIASAAGSWAASAKPGQKRMPLEKWLAAERYDEADRRPPPKPERGAAEQVSPPAPANDDIVFGRYPVGAFLGRFIQGHVHTDTSNILVVLTFQIDTPGPQQGNVIEVELFEKCCMPHMADDGRAAIESICRAVGLTNVTDTDALLQKPLQIESDGRTITYRPAADREAA